MKEHRRINGWKIEKILQLLKILRSGFFYTGQTVLETDVPLIFSVRTWLIPKNSNVSVRESSWKFFVSLLPIDVWRNAEVRYIMYVRDCRMHELAIVVYKFVDVDNYTANYHYLEYFSFAWTLFFCQHLNNDNRKLRVIISENRNSLCFLLDKYRDGTF